MQYVYNLIILNGVIALFLTIPGYLLWRRSGELLARTLFLCFLAGLLTLLIQLQERENNFVIALLFTSSTITHVMFAQLISQVAGFHYPWKRTVFFVLLAVFATTLLHWARFPFKVYSVPIVAASGFPLIYTLIKSFYNRDRLGLFGRIFIFILALYTLGLFQYPFTRTIPEFAFITYCILLFFQVAISVSLYSIVLEQQIIKKSQALTDLEQSKDMLVEKESKAVIGELSAGLAHEINNQMVFVSFLNTLIKKLPPENSEDIKDLAEDLCDGRDRIVGLLKDFQGLATKQEMNYKKTYTHLRKVVESSIQLSKMDLDVKRKQIVFKSFFDGEALINRNKIIQVMVNLLRNAAHAIEKNEDGEITVLIENKGDHATISISDNGIGIKPDDMEKIWEPFFTTKGEHGTGIGLDVCRQVIEEHNGTINCVSKVEEGTTFTIYLPLEA